MIRAVLMCPSHSGLQKVIEYASEHNIKFNTQKRVGFVRRIALHETVTFPSFVLDAGKITVLKNVNYLGYVHIRRKEGVQEKQNGLKSL